MYFQGPPSPPPDAGTRSHRKAGPDACRYQLIPEQKEDERRYTCLDNGGTKIIKIHKKQKVSDE